MKAILQLHINYYGRDAYKHHIHEVLQNLVEHAADHGLLRGASTHLHVEESTFEIFFEEDPVRATLQAIVENYDDTGCEECGVIDAALVEKARSVLHLT